MKATPIFFAFFLLFTSASVAVPIPLFPGNMISPFLTLPLDNYVNYIEAIINGLTYGFVTCLVFFLVDKKLENSMSVTKD